MFNSGLLFETSQLTLQCLNVNKQIIFEDFENQNLKRRTLTNNEDFEDQNVKRRSTNKLSLKILKANLKRRSKFEEKN